MSDENNKDNVLMKVKGGKLMFFCPACECGHWFGVEKPCNVIWNWNGDYIKPTVTPSILTGHIGINKRCHSYITDGKIKFLSDCWHDLKGQTVPLKPF